MDTERNLLFGVLALQADLIDAVQFAEACTAWSMRKQPPLADLLIERGWITREDQAHVEYLLERKLKRFGGDVQASLASVADERARRSLMAIGEAAIQQSLANLTPPLMNDPGMTRPPTSPPDQSRSGRPLVTTFTYETQTRDRYRLIHLHAVGGIGQIWLTRDGDLGRTVALKELRPEADMSPRMRARFLDEARITGQLEHPGIVPVYELARRVNDQQPFYTMRFLKGRTLTEGVRVYHQKRAAGKAGPLDLLGLLNAFVAVCNAMAYAHARGVIHRDLKGQNVILGDFGEVVVLDWGLAKLVARPASDSEMEPVDLEQELDREQTLQGQVLGTPAYMAPEQATGRQDLVDSRTDVYGLGAVLYEILTGRPPFTGANTNEVLKKVQNEEPARPSQVVAAVPPPLEAVCLRALAKKPKDRYASAADLAKEIQRWLADEPVAAYREPFTARLGRWARRHKPVVAGAAALVFTAIPALFISNLLIGRQQARAEANFQMARDAVDRFYVRVSENRLLNEPGMQTLRRDLLQTAREFYQDFVDGNQNDPARRADLGKVLIKLAKITDEVSDRQQALALSERALGIFTQLSERHPEIPDYRSSQAACYFRIGVLCRANDRARAENAYQMALHLFESLAHNYPNVPDYKSKLAGCHMGLGLLYEKIGRKPEAESSHLRALDIEQELADQDPQNLDYQADLAGIHSNLGNFYASAGKWDQARNHHGKALTIRKELAQGSPRVLPFQRDLAQSYNNLGMLDLATLQWPEAHKHLTACLAIREKLAGRNPSVIEYQRELASVHGNLGTVYAKMRNVEEAENAYKKAAAILEELLVASPNEIRLAVDLGEVYSGLGEFFNNQKKSEAALDWYSRAIRTLEPTLRPGQSPSAAKDALRDAYWSRAQAQGALQRKEEALADWNRAIELDDGPHRLELRLERADTLARLAKHIEATAEADSLARQEGVQAESLYQLACIFPSAPRPYVMTPSWPPPTKRSLRPNTRPVQ